MHNFMVTSHPLFWFSLAPTVVAVIVIMLIM